VDVGRFRPDPVARAAVRADLGLADGDIAVLYLGRLHRDKGLAELGDAFAELAARRPALHLLLAGPDEGALALLQNATLAFRDRVHVIGLTREPQKYMAAADVFCLPSYREGFGLSLLEAAAAGVPCVASRIYGITDAVEDGVTGLLVPVRDAAALAEGLRRLVDDPDLRARMGEAARLRATRRFSSGVLLAAWRELYSRQLSRPRG
ncbi:MAG TPA: glycosyltransferase, partial [Ramlibacter sp.]|nr:glycosyltransferase [Ramlibacter sp.]